MLTRPLLESNKNVSKNTGTNNDDTDKNLVSDKVFSAVKNRLTKGSAVYSIPHNDVYVSRRSTGTRADTYKHTSTQVVNIFNRFNCTGKCKIVRHNGGERRESLE